MNYNDAWKKLKEYEQKHVLQYYDTLSENEKTQLLNQIENTDISVVNYYNKRNEKINKKIRPLNVMDLDEIRVNKDKFKDIGSKAIKTGKVGVVMLAGGMGTRLGSDNPKGMYNIGITKEVYIFQRQIENLLDVVNSNGAWIHLFIMTSEKNDAATRKFLKEKNYFGYKEEFITFYIQDLAPAVDYNGKILMEEKYKMSTSPNGNGGWFSSMLRCDAINVAKKAGIEWLNIFSVDNVLQRIADPIFVGATIDSKSTVGSKVVRKNAPDEKVGVMCLNNGHPSIVEYYELTDEMMNAKNEKGEPAYNFGVILNYLFKLDELIKLSNKTMPLHIVEKKIKYIDEDGNHISPEKPNGYKFETLVLDMIELSESCLPFEVIREYEFAPIKNATGVDSVESARELCKKCGINL